MGFIRKDRVRGYYDRAGSVGQVHYYSFNGPIILFPGHMVKPAGASCDVMRVLALWLSLGNAQVVMPTSSPFHPGTRLAKPAFSVSGRELFRPAVDASVPRSLLFPGTGP